MGQQKYSDSQAKDILLAAARPLMASDANFTVAALLEATGIARSQFRRCFATKEQLLTALTQEGVRDLSAILDAAQPARVAQEASLQAAVGSDIAPSSAPSSSLPVTDAWLERRLRVFERALAQLEKRQEKSEQQLSHQLALIAEKLDGRIALPATPQAPEAIVTPEPATAPVEAPLRQAPIPETQTLPDAPIVAPTVIARIEENADFELPASETGEKPVSEKEIADFITQARRVARETHLATPAEPPRQTRWLAWSGVALICALACVGILFASGALHAQSTMQAGSGVSHRRVAMTGMARLVALADSGDSAAQTALALAYLRGHGVAGDRNAAQRWSMAAAVQGQPVAQYLLGALYLEGGRDGGQAVRWFHAAAVQGNVKAMHNLAIAYAQGLGVEKDPAQAVQWFTRAAAQGYRDSQFDLAVLYERGLGVPQNARTALKWYLIAAAHGDAPSAARAEFLQGQMPQKDVNQAGNDATAFVASPTGHFANDMPAI